MESILAESAPRRGRAVAFAVALAAVAVLFVVPHQRHRDRHDHHALLRLENCRYAGYVFVAQ